MGKRSISKNRTLKNSKKSFFSSKQYGGSPGLDKLGYGWNGANEATWPGAVPNADSITRSNHLQVSPYGVPAGGVELPYSTYADNTGNSSKPVSSCTYNLLGGYKYGSDGAKKKSTRKRSAKKRSAPRGGAHRGGAHRGGTRNRGTMNRGTKRGGTMNRGTKRGGTRKGGTKRGCARKNSRKIPRRKQRGGLFLQDIRNLGRKMVNKVKTQVNGVRGIPAPIGIMPTTQPIGDKVKIISTDIVDVEGIYKANSESIAKM